MIEDTMFDNDCYAVFMEEEHEKEKRVRDNISRQAAIDTISCDITVTGRQNAELVAATIESFADRIKALPSAEPEIIHCKDCRHGVDYYHEGDCYCTNPKWGLMYFGGSWEFYCADAERRDDD